MANPTPPPAPTTRDLEAAALRDAIRTANPFAGLAVEKYRAHRAGMEGGGYTAVLVWDGEVRAKLSNDGNGGQDRIDFTPSDGRMLGGDNCVRFMAFVARLPAVPCFGRMLAPDVDLVIGSLVEDADARKTCQKRTVFRVNGVTLSLNAPYNAAMRAYVQRNYPTAEICNETLAGQTAG